MKFTFASSLVIVAAVLLMCVGLSVQEVKTSRAERVHHFEMSEAKDEASWRAFGREWRVSLQLSDVVEDNHDYYHGTLQGDESAVVSFSILPGLGFSGMIATANETWWIRSLLIDAEADSEDRKYALFMYQESSVEIDETLIPSLHNPLHEEVETEAAAEENVDGENKRKAVSSYKVAVYVDERWLSTGNPWRSQADTIGLFNDVNAIYKAAGLKEFRVVYQNKLSNRYSNLNDMLNFLGNQGNLASFKDSTYTNQLWLVGSNVGGLAYVGSSCNARGSMRLKTAVAGLSNFSRLFTVKTIAHELGHNRGAPHDFTNQCSGRTTGCQCSVMSYCFPTANNNPQGAKNFFSSTSISQMRRAGCD